MGKRSPESFIKRQREMDKKRKAEQKRQRRIERRDVEPDADRIVDQEGETISPPPRPATEPDRET